MRRRDLRGRPRGGRPRDPRTPRRRTAGDGRRRAAQPRGSTLGRDRGVGGLPSLARARRNGGRLGRRPHPAARRRPFPELGPAPGTGARPATRRLPAGVGRGSRGRPLGLRRRRRGTGHPRRRPTEPRLHDPRRSGAAGPRCRGRDPGGAHPAQRRPAELAGGGGRRGRLPLADQRRRSAPVGGAAHHYSPPGTPWRVVDARGRAGRASGARPTSAAVGHGRGRSLLVLRPRPLAASCGHGLGAAGGARGFGGLAPAAGRRRRGGRRGPAPRLVGGSSGRRSPVGPRDVAERPATGARRGRAAADAGRRPADPGRFGGAARPAAAPHPPAAFLGELRGGGGRAPPAPRRPALPAVLRRPAVGCGGGGRRPGRRGPRQRRHAARLARPLAVGPTARFPRGPGRPSLGPRQRPAPRCPGARTRDGGGGGPCSGGLRGAPGRRRAGLPPRLQGARDRRPQRPRGRPLVGGHLPPGPPASHRRRDGLPGGVVRGPARTAGGRRPVGGRRPRPQSHPHPGGVATVVRARALGLRLAGDAAARPLA